MDVKNLNDSSPAPREKHRQLQVCLRASFGFWLSCRTRMPVPSSQQPAEAVRRRHGRQNPRLEQPCATQEAPPAAGASAAFILGFDCLAASNCPCHRPSSQLRLSEDEMDVKIQN